MTNNFKHHVLALLIITVSVFFNCRPATTTENVILKSDKKDLIINRIKTPKIPENTVNIADFGAVGNGTDDCIPAIDAAINEVSKKGGGKVIFSKGTYFCKGSIYVKSNINLHFEEGSTVIFSQNPEDYLPVQLVRWEGVELYNYAPYFYANNEQNIAITGTGTLNGNAIGGIANWRKKQKASQNLSRQMGKDLVPVKQRIFGEGHFLRMSFIQFMSCSNILIKDINIENVPVWVVHPTYCTNVTIQNININSTRINNDGIDVDSCEDVLIENCKFNAGDDAIAIKSGRGQDAWRVNKPSKNIVVRNCLAENVLHGMAFGSEMSGGMEQIYVDNFFMKNVKKYGVQFKANKDRGGYIRDVFIDGVFIDSTKTAILFTNDYHSYSGGKSPSSFHDIEIKNLTCNYARGAGIDIQGLEEKPINNLNFKNIVIRNEGGKSILSHIEESKFDNVIINNKGDLHLVASR